MPVAAPIVKKEINVEDKAQQESIKGLHKLIGEFQTQLTST